ncbi:HNH endonuclease [Haloimpatiens sp. FM7315]|uniref:HNH endonuclease n=1 Tax=Haloimpatiens sp. FM7315 TaxID=3298609 RepID=UPI0035A2AFFC
MGECIVCGDIGERHHIVFKNQGGFDFPFNYIYLCPKHHRGKNGPHKNRKIDIEYKLNMQRKLLSLLGKDFYDLNELKSILSINPKQAKSLVSKINKRKDGYSKEAVVKNLMGGKFYYSFMLDDNYNDSFNIIDEEILIYNEILKDKE